MSVAGLGLTAATLDTAKPVGGSSQDQVLEPPDPRDDLGSSDQRTGSGGDANQSAGSSSSYQSLTTCVSFLDTTLGTLSVLLAVLGIALLIYSRYNAALALFTTWTIFPPIMLGYFLVTDCGGGAGIAVGNSASGGFATGGQGIVTATDVPSWMLIALVGLLMAGAAAVLYRTVNADEAVVPQAEDDDDDVHLDQFAEAAGRAADRIEEHNEDVDNTVYRAWIEMTELLDVDSPETYSAGEFADAAVEIGMNEDDVSELTHLFNEVRYGGKDAGAREEQAVSILRNVESQYGTTDGQTDDTDDTPIDEPAGDGEGDQR
ncbi:DUF4129 domain-containing protein [Natronoarchaeum philippinense]|uniref:DUF4129 domain-containing protein n=1 Tax=Natronoarchaeum philippinense TaxID=558529 RepID=UPI0015C9CE9C|nr:DUF4129 domain-containing protein [Natronoarchaeum philippinense]